MATVTYQNQVVTVANLSCATVRPALTNAMNWSGYTAISCSADPVVVGTSVTFTNQYGTPYTQSITAVTGSITTGTGTTSTTCTADTTPFDYTYASGIWALAFTSVITLYVVSLQIGTVLNLIRGR
jgi:hypothetical protein